MYLANVPDGGGRIFKNSGTWDPIIILEGPRQENKGEEHSFIESRESSKELL